MSRMTCGLEYEKVCWLVVLERGRIIEHQNIFDLFTTLDGLVLFTDQITEKVITLHRFIDKDIGSGRYTGPVASMKSRKLRMMFPPFYFPPCKRPPQGRQSLSSHRCTLGIFERSTIQDDV